MNRREVVKGIGLTIAVAAVPSIVMARNDLEVIKRGHVFLMADRIDHHIVQYRVYANAATKRWLGRYEGFTNLCVCDSSEEDLDHTVEIVKEHIDNNTGYEATGYSDLGINQADPKSYTYDPRTIMEYYWQ